MLEHKDEYIRLLEQRLRQIYLKEVHGRKEGHPTEEETLQHPTEIHNQHDDRGSDASRNSTGEHVDEDEVHGDAPIENPILGDLHPPQTKKFNPQKKNNKKFKTHLKKQLMQKKKKNKKERFVLVQKCQCVEMIKSVCMSVPSIFSPSGSHFLFFEKD